MDLLTLLNYRWASSLVNENYTADDFPHFVALSLGIFKQIVLNFIFKSCYIRHACWHVWSMHSGICTVQMFPKAREWSPFLSFPIWFLLKTGSPHVSGAHWLAGLAGQWVSGILLSLLNQHRCFTGGFTGVHYPAQCAYVGGKDLNSALIYMQQAISLISNPLSSMAPNFL